MENEEDCYDQDLEDRIVRIVSKIKKNRNRPCYQNIFTMLVRGGKAIEMDELKEFINNLVERSILLNKGNDERGESFCLGSFLDTEINNIDVDNSISTETESVLENFINESFYNTLINKIKDEVKIAVFNELSEVNNLKTVNSDRYTNNCAKECNCNPYIIETLNKHVDFLQKELSSKDTIINMLINDKCVTNVGNNSKLGSLNKNITEPRADRNTTYNYKQTFSKQAVTSHTHKKNCNNNESDFEPVNPRKKTVNQRSISIIGDSILKEMDPDLMRKKLQNKSDKLYVHSFKGATVQHMKHHAQPVMG